MEKLSGQTGPGRRARARGGRHRHRRRPRAGRARRGASRWASDAEMILGTRAPMDDAAFEKTMREVLNLDW